MKDINYAWSVSAINRDDLLAFEEWYSLYEAKHFDKDICIWGAGIRGTEFGIFIKRHNNDRFVYIDNNKEKWEGHIDGAPIISPDEGVKFVKNRTHVILISTENYQGIKEQLESYDLIFDKDFFVAHNFEYENYVKEFNRKPDCKYMIMGDCLFSGISIRDTCRENLAEMIKGVVGKSQCKVLYMHGMGIRAYYNIFRLYCENHTFPECVEVMINFEMLTGKQHLLPRSQHSHLFELLKDGVENINEEFEEYLEVVKDRSNNIQTEMSHSSKKLTKEQEQYLKNKNYLKINYMYDLDEEVEGLLYFEKLYKYAYENGIKVVAFIPPLNYILGQQIFGDKLENAYNRNLDKIKKIMSKLGVELIDFSHSLTCDYFAEIDTTDESLNEKGREYICRKLVKLLKIEKGESR